MSATSGTATNYDGISKALKHLAYVTSHGSTKLDQAERYELGQAVRLLKSMTAPEPEPADLDACRCAACLGIADDYEPIPATFVQPSPPWYLGLDGKLYRVPTFPKIASEDVVF